MPDRIGSAALASEREVTEMYRDHLRRLTDAELWPLIRDALHEDADLAVEVGLRWAAMTRFKAGNP